MQAPKYLQELRLGHTEAKSRERTRALLHVQQDTTDGASTCCLSESALSWNRAWSENPGLKRRPLIEDASSSSDILALLHTPATEYSPTDSTSELS